METSQFIYENRISNIEELKNVFEKEPYNLKIKEDANINNLFVIHNTDKSDFNLKIVNECNGLILDKNSLKIICYTFDKCSNSLEIPTNIDFNNLYIENAIEGTLVRLYYANDNWLLSTKKCIDSSKASWISSKSFHQMFNECLNTLPNNIEHDKLNKNYCYSFIIIHPENNIVVKYQYPILYHISTRDMKSFEEIDVDIGVEKMFRTKVEPNQIQDIIENLMNTRELFYEGIIFIDTKFRRWKIRTPIFNRARELWGNTNSRLFRYIELRKDSNMLDEYLIYFPADRNIFTEYENKLKNLSHDILKYYSGKHILKNIEKVPYYYSKIIYRLHGDFFKDKFKTNYTKIMVTLLDTDVKLVCYMLNNYEKSLENKNNEEIMTTEDVLDYIV
jgi:hypothetical protein